MEVHFYQDGNVDTSSTSPEAAAWYYTSVFFGILGSMLPLLASGIFIMAMSSNLTLFRHHWQSVHDHLKEALDELSDDVIAENQHTIQNEINTLEQHTWTLPYTNW